MLFFYYNLTKQKWLPHFKDKEIRIQKEKRIFSSSESLNMVEPVYTSDNKMMPLCWARDF